jgi:osmoprotectant transport system ATP-binding protein
MIALDQVAKTYDGGRNYAVRDVSLVVAEGEFVVLLGESGCGKTTTLKMINRLIAPSAGTIRVDGDDTADLDPVALRRRIGYVFQEVGLFPHLSVAANAGAVLKLLGRPPADIARRTNAVLEQVGLDPTLFGRRRPAELSGGERQRVGVARALAARPRIMLMDEPFGALDPLTRAELQTQFRALQRELSLTVVMVTHDMTEALLLADRIAIMSDGTVVASGTPGALLANPGHAYAARLLAAPRQQADQLGKLLGGADS